MSNAFGALQLKPQLKPNVDVFRHVYRGEVWYLFHDRSVDRFYRMSAAGADIVAAMDGKRSLADIFDDYSAQSANDEIDPQRGTQFLAQLNALGLMRLDTAPDAEALERKRDMIRQRRLFASLKSPLTLRIPLIDPTPVLRLLEKISPYLFNPLGLTLWALVVLTGAIVGGLHWGELTIDLTDRLLSLQNLAVAAFVYPFIKVVHDFAHALVLRHYGGEVRRMGVIVVGFMPVPYVDASSSVVLSNKYWRIMVDAAGIMSELFIAALAIIGWSMAEPSFFRTVCYDIVMISGLSTLLFNGNPLQRYDGYYILSDWAEIPGLGMRAAQQMMYYVRRYLLADDQAQPPAATPGERIWFLIYGPASFLYRTALVFTIVFYVMHAYPLIGTALGIWTFAGVLGAPATALVRVARTPDRTRRGNAGKRLVLVIGAVCLLLFVVPVPSGVVTSGVVWLPDDANARPLTAGEVIEVMAAPGMTVEAGAPILRLENRETAMRVAKAQAALAEMNAAYTQAFAESRVQAAIYADKVIQAQKALVEAKEEQNGLLLRSPATGRIIFSNYPDLPGRYLGKGEVAAVIWNGGKVTVRAMVPMGEIDQIRAGTKSVGIRLAYDPMTEIPARISRIVPAATDELPSAVLSLEGGGPFAVAMDSPAPGMRGNNVVDRAPHMSEAMFEVDVQADRPLPVEFLNGAAKVRFDLGWEPAGIQLYRYARLVFLRYFNV